MEVTKAYRYELIPSKGQEVRMRLACGTARFTYNWGLDYSIKYYKKYNKSLSAIDLHKVLCSKKRTDFPWMYSVSKCAPQGALRNLERSFKRFYSKKSKFPRFKRKGKCKDSFYLDGSIKIVNDRKVQLPKLGKVRTKENTSKFKGSIISAVVSREADRWFVSISTKVDHKVPSRNDNEVIGIDLGLNSFITDNNGNKVEAPKPLKKQIKKLKKRQRKHSRKKKGSNNRRKSAIKLARLHRKIRNIRKDFIHKLTTKLSKTKRVIVMEDLQVTNMVKNHKLARSIMDVSWFEFKRQLGYKCIWYGSELIIIDKFFPSTKRCSRCGSIKSISLSERIYTCENCGLEIDRDTNSAINIRDEGLKLINTGSSPEIYACGHESSG